MCFNTSALAGVEQVPLVPWQNLCTVPNLCLSSLASKDGPRIRPTHVPVTWKTQTHARTVVEFSHLLPSTHQLWTYAHLANYLIQSLHKLEESTRGLERELVWDPLSSCLCQLRSVEAFKALERRGFQSLTQPSAGALPRFLNVAHTVESRSV